MGWNHQPLCEVGAPPLGHRRILSPGDIGCPLVTAPKRWQNKRCLYRKTRLFSHQKIRLESKGLSKFDSTNPVKNRPKRPPKRKWIIFQPFLFSGVFFCCLCQGGWNAKIQSMDICWGLLLFWQILVVSSPESMGIQPYLFITHSLNGIVCPFLRNQPTKNKHPSYIMGI